MAHGRPHEGALSKRSLQKPTTATMARSFSTWAVPPIDWMTAMGHYRMVDFRSSRSHERHVCNRPEHTRTA